MTWRFLQLERRGQEVTSPVFFLNCPNQGVTTAVSPLKRLGQGVIAAVGDCY